VRDVAEQSGPVDAGAAPSAIPLRAGADIGGPDITAGRRTLGSRAGTHPGT
jgi:hypothetical protein